MSSDFMKRIEEAKSRCQGMIALFRVGDFYEAFGDDAKAISSTLGLTLTTREKMTPMAGFPHHQLEACLRKLFFAGHKVAILTEGPATSKRRGSSG